MKNKFKIILTALSLFIAICTSAQTTYEAETSFIPGNGTIIKSNTFASGGSVVGNFKSDNAFAKYSIINGGSGGAANLIIKYSNGTGVNQSLTYHYYVGTTAVACNQVTFPPTADWNTFAEVTISINISSGTNSLKFQKVVTSAVSDDISSPTAGGVGPDIDNFTLSFVKWTGAVSTAYENPSNWLNNAVPPVTSIINIPAGLINYPVINANQTIAGATISSGASLTISSGVSLIVTGSSISNAYGTLFSNGVITNTGTITNNGSLTNNGDLILLSGTAGTSNLVSSTSVSNVTQQRFLSSNQRGWRLLSNPLANTTFSTLAAASNLTLGTNYTGQYDSVTNTWSMSDGTVAMNNNTAYKVFITGQSGESPGYTSGPTNVTLVDKGTAANNAPSAVTTIAGQYYLVANPYTAPVSVARILLASTGLSTTVSYYNPTKASTDVKVKAGGFDVKTIPTGALNEGVFSDLLIPPMGAIFVQATTSGTINIPKSAIFTGMPSRFNSVNSTGTIGVYTHKTAQTRAAVASVALTIDVASNGLDYDQLQLLFKEDGTAGSNVDFGKLPNTFLDFYSIDNSTNRSVSELELKAQTIPLGITSTVQKSFTFKVAENTIPAGFEAVLVDTYLNKNTVITPTTNYTFAIDSNPASQGNGRFAINLKTSGSLANKANELDAKIQLWPNPASGQFNISNTLEGDSTIEISGLNGQVIHTQKLNLGNTTIQTKSWPVGVYIIKATNNGTETIKKLIIQ